MKKLFNISAKLKSEKGVTLVYVAILLVVFLGIAALAVDIGYLMVRKTELQKQLMRQPWRPLGSSGMYGVTT